MHEQWSVDSAIHKLFHDRELGLLREDNVLDDDVGAFSELGQDNLDLAIALDLATKPLVFVEDGVLVLSLQLFNGDVQMVILHHIQVVHRRVAIHRVRRFPSGGPASSSLCQEKVCMCARAIALQKHREVY